MFYKTKNLIAGLIIFTLAFSLFGVADAREVDPDFNPNNLLSDEEMLDYQSMSLKDIENFLAGKSGVLKNYACREIEIEKTAEVEDKNSSGSNNGEVDGEQACNNYLDPAIHLDPNKSNSSSNQIVKLQDFLGVQKTKIYDQVTVAAVKKFQNKYAAEVLAPWGLTSGNGYVGKTTIGKINELYCQKLNVWSGSLGVAVESDSKSTDGEEDKKTETVWRCFLKSDPLPKKETDGREWTAAEVIYNLAKEYKISPKMILVTLQKEQSLISNSSPTQGSRTGKEALNYALDWAMGYGCLERGGWNEKLRGFYKQVDGACWQFRRWFDYPENYTHSWQKGVTYYGGIGTSGLDNEIDVTPASNATAFLYRYTPHIFNGNYNFWKFWREYFGEAREVSEVKGADKIILNSNLLQNPNTPLYYLDDGLKRSLGGLSKTELSELGFDESRATQVSLKIINSYPTGKKIKYGADGALMESLEGEVYLIENGKKRKFYSNKSVKDSGYQLSEVKKVADSQLDYYLAGEAMPFPDGALIKADGPAVYKIESGARKEFTSPALFEVLGCRWEEIIEVDKSELANYPNGDLMKYPAGVLIRAIGYEKVYLIENGKASWIKTEEEFIKNGYDWGEVIGVNMSELDLYL